MRIDFDIADDGRAHEFCLQCKAESVARVTVGGQRQYDCVDCGRRSDRSIFVDPAVVWWLDDEREYWHESAGVFLFRPDGRLLLFERIDFPVQWTVPAGHVDAGETAILAAARELNEEVGLYLSADSFRYLGSEDIRGDSCSRGSDAHRWHAFAAEVADGVSLQVLEEGKNPVWLTISQALEQDLTVPVRLMLTRNFAVTGTS